MLVIPPPYDDIFYPSSPFTSVTLSEKVKVYLWGWSFVILFQLSAVSFQYELIEPEESMIPIKVLSTDF
jgi:hypothetical protein